MIYRSFPNPFPKDFGFSKDVTIDKSLTIGKNGSYSGSLTFIASDGDQANIALNTSDQLVFSGASGGYSYDSYIFGGIATQFKLINDTTTISGAGIFYKTTAYSRLMLESSGGGYVDLVDNNATSNNKWWQVSYDGTTFAINKLNDNGTLGSTPLKITNTGSVTFSGVGTFGGELGYKIYSQISEPTLATGMTAIWVDTDDSNRTYLLINNGTSQKKVELL